MFSVIFSQALTWRLLLLLALPLVGLGGRGEVTIVFPPFFILDLRVKLSLSLRQSLESEFDFLIPLNLLNISIVLLFTNTASTSSYCPVSVAWYTLVNTPLGI